MTSPNSSGAGFTEALSPGDRVGGARYLLKRLLGRGTTSEVWLAQEVLVSRQMALKFFPPVFLTDAALVERLNQETQRHLLLKHPHIASTYDLVRDPSAIALAMEYVDGWSLASSKVDKLCGCYRVEEIESWIWQLCAALEFAHQEVGIIHGDLKPANLLINTQDELKITDFAIATIVRQESVRRGLAKGLYAGLGFLSPQQAAGEEPTKLDDIYSLGATIFDLLTSTPPFYQGEVFAQICSLAPPPMTARIKELEIQDDPVSPVWEDTVARCLAKKPADRPQSVGEVLALLQRASVPKPAEPVTVAAVPAEPVIIESAAVAPESKSEAPEKLPEAVTPDKAVPAVETPPTPSAPPPLAAPMVSPPVRSQMPLILGGFALLAAVICAAGVIAVLSLKHEVATTTASITKATNSAVVTSPGAPGLVDTGFNTGVGADGEVRTLALQPDGKILVGGRFTSFNNAAHKSIARLNPDGTLDDSFQYQGNSPVNAVGLTDDGEIFIAGNSMLKGHPRTHILRLAADGSVDRSFSLGSKLNLEIHTLAVQSDAKVIVGGSVMVAAAKTQARLMRFDPDGKPDVDFDANVSASGTVWTLAIQPDGKILVAGGFTRFNDADAGRIVRLNASGTLDPHFSSGSGADGNILALAMQSDGEILIAGDFTHVNGRPYPHLARLNPDGTVDTTLAIGAGADKNIRSVVVQPDGKIIIAGDFTTFQEMPCHRLARLNADGSLDKSFNAGSGSSGVIGCAALQPDGKIVLGGGFTVFDGGNCGEIVRLNNATGHH